MPSKSKRGESVTELTENLTAKIHLLNEMQYRKVRPGELARRIGRSLRASERPQQHPGYQPYRWFRSEVASLRKGLCFQAR